MISGDTPACEQTFYVSSTGISGNTTGYQFETYNNVTGVPNGYIVETFDGKRDLMRVDGILHYRVGTEPCFINDTCAE